MCPHICFIKIGKIKRRSYLILFDLNVTAVFFCCVLTRQSAFMEKLQIRLKRWGLNVQNLCKYKNFNTH